MMVEGDTELQGAAADDPYDAIVLAGGRGSRLGLVDKATLDVGDGPLLAGVLEAVAAARHVVVVGPPRDLPAHIHQVREEPVFGGPAAAVVTGLHALPTESGTDGAAPWTIVLGCDLPLARQAVPLLLATRRDEGCVLADGEGHAQWVAGVYSTSALVAAAESLGDATDRPLRALLGRLSTRALAAPGRVGDDVDTWDQVSEWNDYFIDGEDADESSADDEPEERSANE